MIHTYWYSCSTDSININNNNNNNIIHPLIPYTLGFIPLTSIIHNNQTNKSLNSFLHFHGHVKICSLARS